MNYKIPRIVEKKPSIMGINVLPFAAVVFSILFFIFTVKSNWKMAFGPLIFVGAFVALDKIYNKQKGGLIRFILSPLRVECVKFDKNINSLLNNSTTADIDLEDFRSIVEKVNDNIDNHLENIGVNDDNSTNYILEDFSQDQRYLDEYEINKKK